MNIEIVEMLFKDEIAKIRSENWRYYHTYDNHIKPMIMKVLSMDIDDISKKTYIFACIYHDYVYDPKSKLNELNSIDAFRNKYSGYIYFDLVRKCILSTMTHEETDDEFVNEFIKLDLMLFDSDFEGLIKNLLLIRKEYQFYELNSYKEGTIEILKRFLKNPLINTRSKNNIEREIQFLKLFQPKIGALVGSFNPFTIGHFDILQKAQSIFDEVILVKAKNLTKNNEVINQDLFKLNYYRFVETNEPIIDFIKSHSYKITLIRGLRNNSDFQAELNYQSFLRDIYSDINIVNIFTELKYQHISSSSVRELIKIYGIESNIVKSYLL